MHPDPNSVKVVALPFHGNRHHVNHKIPTRRLQPQTSTLTLCNQHPPHTATMLRSKYCRDTICFHIIRCGAKAHRVLQQSVGCPPPYPAMSSSWITIIPSRLFSFSRALFRPEPTPCPLPPNALLAIARNRNETSWDNRWQPSDYADFRVNYATHMHNPSIEEQEQEREGATGPAPAVPVATNADSPAAVATATVEGVLVVAASPAPAPLTARSANPDEGLAEGRRHDGAGVGGGGGGSDKVGSGAGGGAAAPSQERVQSKSPRYEKVRREVADEVESCGLELETSPPQEELCTCNDSEIHEQNELSCGVLSSFHDFPARFLTNPIPRLIDTPASHPPPRPLAHL